MSSINVAIIGVGNCASSLVQGVTKYADATNDDVIPGLMHPVLGEYGIGDINFVADFDQPRIIYATIKGFGTYGPYANIKSFEHIAQAMGGAMSANGNTGDEPIFVAPGVGDSGTGLHCAIGLLAALR